jgi:hypothetical protein
LIAFLTFLEAQLGILDLFRKSSQKSVVHDTKVLVCGLHPKFADQIESDSQIYSRFYPSTKTTSFTRIDDLLTAIRGNDIVHLFADVSATGMMVDENGGELLGTDLIRKCGDLDVKLLWVASDNKPDGYIKGFKPVKPLNLVMTLDRNGTNFTAFLGQLLSEMTNGKTMPTAWAVLSPQNRNDPRQARLPATIFSAGRGNVIFR